MTGAWSSRHLQSSRYRQRRCLTHCSVQVRKLLVLDQRTFVKAIDFCPVGVPPLPAVANDCEGFSTDMLTPQQRVCSAHANTKLSPAVAPWRSRCIAARCIAREARTFPSRTLRLNVQCLRLLARSALHNPLHQSKTRCRRCGTCLRLELAVAARCNHN